MYHQTGKIVDEHTDYHQEYICRLAPSIEDEREDYEHSILEGHDWRLQSILGSVMLLCQKSVYQSAQKVAECETRDEYVEEKKIRENHYSVLLYSGIQKFTQSYCSIRFNSRAMIAPFDLAPFTEV